jgi:hypothetical protein
MNNNGNIVLNQIINNSFKELIPFYEYSDRYQALITKDNSIFWAPIDLSLNIIVDNKFKETNIYYDNGRLGLGRFPLYNYKVDIAVPKDTLMTAWHVGDGSFGFSMGNGATTGFIPEIIGIGSDETDAGLYFVGIAGNNNSSDIPLILIDGRNTFNQKLTNRPIFGITSGNYNECVVLIDASENLNVKGNVITNDVILDNQSLLELIKDLQQQISKLKV